MRSDNLLSIVIGSLLEQLLFTVISDIMDSDDIWRYWMHRDLQIVMDKYNNELPTNWPIDPRTMRLPWKYTYLWSRLVVAAKQSLKIEFINFSNTDIPKITFKSLNIFTVQMTPESPKEEYDYIVNWSLIYSLTRTQHRSQQVPVYRLAELEWMDAKGLKRFLNQRTYGKPKLIRSDSDSFDNVLAYCILLLQKQIQTLDRAIQPYLYENAGKSSMLELFQDYPRFLERTRLIVANNICSICNQSASLKCPVDNKSYCSEECHAKVC